MATFYLEVTSGGDVLAVDANTALAYQTGSSDGTLVTITPTLEAVGFALPSDIAVYYRSKLTSDPSFGSWQAENTFTLADGDYEVEAQLRYTSTGNPVVQKLDVDGVTLVDVTAVSTTFTVGAADPAPVVLVHDTFTGGGSAVGRTPDTVDNGNVWTAYNGETYSCQTSGPDNFLVPTNDTNDYSKAVTVDMEQDTYTVSALIEWTAVGSYAGVTVCVTNAIDGSESFYKVDVTSTGSFRLVEYTAGTFDVPDIGVPVSISAGTKYWMEVEVTADNIYAKLLSEDKTTELGSFNTESLGDFSLVPNSNAGLWLRSANGRCHEFIAEG